MALANCIIWLLYGIVNPNSLFVITINSIGVVIEVIYVGIFIYHSAGDVRRGAIKILAGMLVGVGLLAGLVFGLAHTDEGRSRGFGILGVASGIGMYAAPLLITVSRRSSSFSPGPFLLM